MKGASAVPEPLSAMVGLASSNSATPPVVKVSGLVWFALTSTGVLVPSARTVCGSTPVVGDQVVAPVADDAGDAGPVVAGGDEGGVGPGLGEGQRLRGRGGRRGVRTGRRRQQQEQDEQRAREALHCGLLSIGRRQSVKASTGKVNHR